MAKPNKLPDFRKMYPEVSEEVITALRKGERKMQYQEFDLKAERTVIDKKTNTMITLPSREDSLERMKDLVYSIADESPGTEVHLTQKGINKRKSRIIKHLGELMKNI